MKRYLLLFLVAMLPMLASAYDAQINGIYYNFSGNEATVTYLVKFSNNNSSAYSGNVTIPRTVTYDDKTYTVTSIGEFAFYRCSSLTSVSIPTSVTSIGQYAFCYCTSMSAITIPNYVSKIGHHAFSDTPWYNNQPDGLLYAGKVAYQYKGSMSAGTEISIKEGTIGIASQAFYECTNLTKVSIPNGVTNIGDEAFYGCISLVDVHSYISFPFEASNDMFADINSKATLYVPQNTKAQYQAAGWTAYFKYVEEMETGINEIFTAQTREGTMMTFRILDKEGKTCQVGNGEEAAVAIGTSGQVTIPQEVYGYKVVAIGNEGFYNRSQLTNIVIPEGIERIGIMAFHKCTGLQVLEIPRSITYISNDAFSECSMQVNIPYDIIGQFSYNHPSESQVVITITPPSQAKLNTLEWIYIPKAVHKIYERCFTGGKLITVMQVESGNTVFDSRDNCNAIIRTADNTLLYGCQTTVIPQTVTSIAAYAFEGHSNLKAITIPKNITSIASYAFSGCTNLMTVTSNVKVPFAISDGTFDANTYENATLSVPAGSKELYQDKGGWKNFANIVERDWTDGDDFIVKTVEGVEMSFIVTSVQNKTCQVVSPAINKATTGSVTIPETARGFAVKNITNSAFSGCTGLTKVTIPNNTTNIGSSAFYGCTSLTTLTIGNNVTSIGEKAFSGCTALTSLTIPRYVTSIGTDAFDNCRSLASISVASANTVYDSRNSCNAIIEKQTNKLIRGCKNTNIPSGVTSISEKAFSGCTGLTSINIPGTMTSIGEYAFNSCTALMTVTSEVKVPFAISDNTFSTGTYQNATLIVPPDTKEAYQAKAGWKKFANISEKERVDGEIYTAQTSEGVEMTFKVISAKNKTCQVEGNSTTPAINKNTTGSITIPGIAKGFSVKSIASYAFYNCTGLTKVTIPSSVSTIDNHAFSNCSGLTYIQVEEDNTTYDSRNNCNAIIRTATNALIVGCKGTVIPETVKAIASYAFEGHSKLNTISIPNSITSIGSAAFSDCTALTSVISKILEPFAISDNTFSNYTYQNATLTIPMETEDYYMTTAGWKNFTNIVEDENVEFHDGDVFTAKTLERIKIKFKVVSAQNKTCQIISPAIDKATTGSITIPEIARGFSVQSIGSNAFQNCTGLTAVTIPGSVTSIGSYAFSSCTSLTSLNIPRKVTSIGDRAFGYCKSLTSISVESGNTVYDSRDYSNAIIKTADNSLRFGCQGTVIPETVKTIAAYAFEGHSSLNTINIPKSMTGIGENAFSGCTSLRAIMSDLKAPFAINDNTFSNTTYQYAILTVPAATKEIYQATAGWMNFINFAEKEHEDGDIFKYQTAEGVYMTFKVISANNKICQVEGTNSSPTVDRATTGNISIPETVKGYSVKYISSYAFSGCSGLTKVTIPGSVTNIGERAFIDCAGLISLTIPSSVISIGTDAFDNCRGLTSISVESGNTVYDSRNSCNAIIEKQTKKLIRGCKRTSIPNGVTSIYEKAFSGCIGLTSINIPESITSIGNITFRDCSALMTVTSDLNTPFAINDNTFNDYTYENARLNVLPDTRELYQATAGWKKFLNIEERDRKDGDIFTAQIAEGVYMTFKVISVKNKTCQVEGTSTLPAIDRATTGSITIPEVVKDYYVTSISSYAFYGCSNLTSVSINNRITSIGSYAFSGCSGLTTIIIPNSVTSIGTGAFDNCSGLTSIYVNYGNTVYNSRNNCNAIIRTADNTLLFGCQKTVIPETVTAIAAYAFKGHSNLNTINIPASITSIGEEAFSGCTNLRAITSNIIEPFAISNGTFSNTTYQYAILSVPAFTKELYLAKSGWKNFSNISEKELIDGETFKDETAEGVEMTFKVISAQDKTCQIVSPAIDKATTGSITIPETAKIYSVKSIANSAFSGCSGLTSVTIPGSVTSIGSSAFYGCTALTSLTIPRYVTSIGTDAFDNCRSLASISVASGNTVYDSRNNCNAIIERQTNKLIRGCKNTNIPNGVTSIGERAFSGCNSLTSINFPESVTSIGNAAFSGCTALMTITSEVKVPFEINDNTFSTTTYQNATLTVPTGTQELYQATAGWNKFMNIVGKEMVDGEIFSAKTVEGVIMWFKVISAQNKTCQVEGTNTSPAIDRATTGSVTIPEFPKGYACLGISSYAFSSCTELTSVTIPGSMISIGEYAFCYCSGLTSITIPSSVTSIGKGAFQGCSGMTSLTVGSGVTSIGSLAFSDCSGLTSIKVETGNTTYDSRNNCNAIIETAKNTLIVGCKSTVIPSSVTRIGNYAFDGCSGLTAITIPEGVTNIESYAFRNCTKLTEVSIPGSMTNIGSNAFRECNSLTDVYCYAEDVPKANNSAFDNQRITYATLHVPDNSIESYRATSPWSNFGEIVPLGGNKCATPTISYVDGELSFNCTTEGVKFYYEIKDDDVKGGSSNKIKLTVTYHISVYAVKDGYNNSDIATATLCWIDQIPVTEGTVDEDAVMEVRAVPVLIQTQGGIITIQGIAKGLPITIYGTDGKLYGSGTSEKDSTTIRTSLRPGSFAIVKIGKESVKVMIK